MKHVYICTQDVHFGEQIVRYVASKQNPHVHIELWTKQTDKNTFQQEDVVISEEEDRLKSLSCQTIRIVRQPEKEKDEICMYQGKEAWYQRLLQCLDVEQEDKEGQPGVVCVFSPEGGEEGTLLALQYCMEQAEKRHVLYVNLCGFPTFFRETLSDAPEGVQRGVSELFLENNQREFERKLEQLAFTLGDVDMIPPVEHYKDFLDFSVEEVMDFMEHLKNQNIYDVVVLEVAQLFEYTFDLLGQSQQILVPLVPGFLAEVKRHVFREYCQKEQAAEILEKIRYVSCKVELPVSAEDIEELLERKEGRSESGRKREKRTNQKFGITANSGE